jgi:hypothetical protein
MEKDLGTLIADALDAEAFRAWLAARPDGSFFITGETSKCPLAVYLQDVVPHPPQSRIVVYTGGCAVLLSPLSPCPLMFNLPLWAQLFVESVDLWDRHESIIIALDAVGVLDRVLVEYGL